MANELGWFNEGVCPATQRLSASGMCVCVHVCDWECVIMTQYGEWVDRQFRGRDFYTYCITGCLTELEKSLCISVCVC